MFEALPVFGVTEFSSIGGRDFAGDFADMSAKE